MLEKGQSVVMVGPEPYTTIGNSEGPVAWTPKTAPLTQPADTDPITNPWVPGLAGFGVGIVVGVVGAASFYVLGKFL